MKTVIQSQLFGLGLALSLVLSPIGSRGDPNDEPTTWVGEVTLVHVRTGHFTGHNSGNPQITADASYKEEYKASLHIKACVGAKNSARLHSSEFHFERADRGEMERDHKLCLDETGDNYTARPGDSKLRESQISGRRDESAAPTIGVHLVVYPDGRYSLMATGGVPYLYYEETREEDFEACSGETKKNSTIIVPEEEGGETGITTEGNHTILRGFFPSVPNTLAVIAEGYVTDGRIEGDTVMIDKTGDGRSAAKYKMQIDEGDGSWEERMTARWEFKPADPCDQVEDQLRQSMALLAAYHDATLLNQGLDAQAYEAAVEKRAAELYFARGGSGSPPKPGKYGTISDMGVNKKCEVVGASAYREAAEQMCVPEIITDAVFEHEFTHVAQCQNNHAEYIRGYHDPLIQSKYEMQAYCVEIGMLLNWLTDNCELNTDDYGQMADGLCQ